MKIKLERDLGMLAEEGETMNYFGVPFVCENREVGDSKMLSEWYADIPAKEARLMAKAGRVEIIGDEK